LFHPRGVVVPRFLPEGGGRYGSKLLPKKEHPARWWGGGQNDDSVPQKKGGQCGGKRSMVKLKPRVDHKGGKRENSWKWGR